MKPDIWPLLALTAILTFPGPVVADSDLQAAMLRCAAIEGSAQRLSCFDAQVAALAQPTQTTAASQATAAQRQSEDDAFGMNATVAAGKPQVEKAPTPAALTLSVTRLQQRSSGAFVVTLENGQIWEQPRAERGLRVKVGDTVTIKRGALGSFRMIARGNKAYKVQRVR